MACFYIQGWKIAVTTWGAKGATDSYNKAVAKVKKEWLERYDFPFDDFFFQPYGESKNIPTEYIKGRKILVDDNEEVRNDWIGETIDATKNILEILQKLVDKF